MSDCAPIANGISLSEPRRAGLPQGLVLFAWYKCIQIGLAGYQPGLSPLVGEMWWRLFSGGFVILFMAGLLSPFLKREGLDAGALGYKTRWTARDAAWGLGAGLLIWLAHSSLMDLVANLSGTGVGNAVAKGIYDPLLRQAGPAERFGVWYGAGVMAPLIEETIYRGCLITSFARRWGGGPRREAAYVLASALIFSLSHALSHPLYGAVYALTGAAFALLYLRTRSLNAAILAHAVVNGTFAYRSFQ